MFIFENKRIVIQTSPAELRQLADKMDAKLSTLQIGDSRTMKTPFSFNDIPIDIEVFEE
jgi:hypothetical protein